MEPSADLFPLCVRLAFLLLSELITKLLYFVDCLLSVSFRILSKLDQTVDLGLHRSFLSMDHLVEFTHLILDLTLDYVAHLFLNVNFRGFRLHCLNLEMLYAGLGGWSFIVSILRFYVMPYITRCSRFRIDIIHQRRID